MGQITVEKNVAGIEGLCVITPSVHSDTRGYFMESYSQRDMKEAGMDITFVQDNQSCSVKGVLRGLHFQKKHPQTKLTRVIKGRVFDVAVDLRRNSSSFGKWHGLVLSDDNQRQLLIPKGFAHGFLVLSDIAVFSYKCDDYYYPNDQGGILWNDPVINIAWPNVTSKVLDEAANICYYLEDGSPIILSDKEQQFIGFLDYCKLQLEGLAQCT